MAITWEERQQIKAEIMAEIAEKKKSDSVWRKAKQDFRMTLKKTLGDQRSYKAVDAFTTIAKMTLEKRTISAIKDDDIPVVSRMLDDLLAVVVKYKEQNTEHKAEQTRANA